MTSNCLDRSNYMGTGGMGMTMSGHSTSMAHQGASSCYSQNYGPSSYYSNMDYLSSSQLNGPVNHFAWWMNQRNKYFQVAATHIVYITCWFPHIKHCTYICKAISKNESVFFTIKYWNCSYVGNSQCKSLLYFISICKKIL